MDALSDVIATLRLGSALYCRSELRGPWGFRLSKRHVAVFHAVRQGSCWLRQEGVKKPLPLSAGDFVVLPGGSAHALSDEPHRKTEDLLEVIARKRLERNAPLIVGSEGRAVTLLCGDFEFARGEVHPLLSRLPPLIHVRGEDGRAAPALEATLELLSRETMQERPGSGVVVNRAMDILFVQLIRAYLDEPTCRCEGWLQGMRDPQIARALAAIHRDPQVAWSLDALAASAGLSRSAFCARFVKCIGEPPHRYLTRWRMQRATELLRHEDMAIKQIAERVGFRDEAVFSKAFKKHVGMPPAAYRHAGKLEDDPTRASSRVVAA